MRWKEKPEPQWHDSRIKEHFLFFPKKIENEWRWLERAKYKQSYEYIPGHGDFPPLGWIDKEWIDEVKNERTTCL